MGKNEDEKGRRVRGKVKEEESMRNAARRTEAWAEGRNHANRNVGEGCWSGAEQGSLKGEFLQAGELRQRRG